MPGVGPTSVAAVHRGDVRVAHLTEVVGGEGGAIAAAAVEHDLGVEVGNLGFDVALDSAFAEVYGAGQTAARPLALLAHVHEVEVVAALQPVVDGSNVGLGDAGARLVHEAEKAGRVFFHRGKV